jgi:hypothetical protein
MAAILRACVDYHKSRYQHREAPPSEKARELPRRIKALKRCRSILQKELLSFGSPCPSISSILFNALIDVDFEKSSTDLDMIASFYKTVNSYDDVATAILVTIDSIDNVRNLLSKQIDLVVISPPAPSHRALFVKRLMTIWIDINGGSLATVRIGNPEFDYNPLLRFLKAVCTPIVGLKEDFPVWIAGATLRAEAEAVRKQSRAR